MKAQEILALAGDMKVHEMPLSLYKQVTQPIIEDLKALKEKDPDFILYVGARSYSPEHLLNHVEQRTIFGQNYVSEYLFGLKFLSTKPQPAPKQKKNFLGF